MKLATLNSQLEFDMETLLPNDVISFVLFAKSEVHQIFFLTILSFAHLKLRCIMLMYYFHTNYIN